MAEKIEYLTRANPVARLSALIANWSEAVRQRHDYVNMVSELSRLSDRELEDIGINRVDIREVARQATIGQ